MKATRAHTVRSATCRELTCILLLLAMLLCSSCEKGNKSYYDISARASGAGEKQNVIDLSISTQCVSVTDTATVTFTVGMGGDGRVEAHEGETMVLKISADGCLINGTENVFEKEYPDYYEDTKYRATVEESYWSYPKKTPNYFEDFEIVFPEGAYSGRIDLELYNKDETGENFTAELTVYYASNGSVLWFSDSALLEVDDKDRPVSADQPRR